MPKNKEKISLNDIIENLNKKFPAETLSELEKARFLYIELAKHLRYDIDMQSIYELKQEESYYKPIDTEDIESEVYSCKQFALIYEELLKKANIDCECITSFSAIDDDPMPHKYNIIHLKDGRNIIVDLTWDVGLVQKGMKTKDFATSTDGNCDTISEEELKKIDAKIGYIYTSKKDGQAEYMDYFLNLVKEELKDSDKIREFVNTVYGQSVKFDPKLITRYKFELISRCFSLEDMGIIEGNNYLKELYDRFFTQDERKQISVIVLENENDGPFNIIHSERKTCYVWKKDKESSEYFLYEEGKNLRPVSKEKMQEIAHEKEYRIYRKSKFPAENPGEDIFR